MGWLTLNGDKLTKVKEICNYEYRLIYLTNALQAAYDGASYGEQSLATKLRSALKEIDDSQASELSAIEKSFASAGSATGMDSSGIAGASASSVFNKLADYTTTIQQTNLKYLSERQETISIFRQKEQIHQDKYNMKQNSIEMEQEQVQTLLQTARAEKEQLDQAISSEIKENTISLV